MWNIVRDVANRWRSNGVATAGQYTRDRGTVAAVQGQTTVLTNGATFATLNESGSRIWELLGQSQTSANIIEIMSAEYDVLPEAVERDVEQVLATLLKLKMISLTTA